MSDQLPKPLHIFDDFLSEIGTKEEADRLVKMAEAMEVDLYKKSDLNGSGGLGTGDETVRVRLKTLMNKSGLEPEVFLDKFKQAVEALTVINLTLAFDWSAGILKRIVEWVKMQVGSKVVIDLVKDEAILGGAVIEYKGVYRDLSVKKQLDEKLESLFEGVDRILKT